MHVMISVHVPKTGGTSFRKVLEDHYGDAFQSDYDWEPRPEILRGTEIEGSDDQVREALRDIQCIHGHFNARKYLRLRSIAGIEPVFVTWLRDPVERAISTYYFLRSLETAPENQPPWERAAKGMTLDSFYANTNFGRNRQFAQLSALPLDEFSFVGCTERYDEGIRVFVQKFFRGFIRGEVPHELKNTSRTSDRYSVAREVRELLKKQNDRDFEMYQYARGWVSGALALEHSTRTV